MSGRLHCQGARFCIGHWLGYIFLLKSSKTWMSRLHKYHLCDCIYCSWALGSFQSFWLRLQWPSTLRRKGLFFLRLIFLFAFLCFCLKIIKSCVEVFEFIVSIKTVERYPDLTQWEEIYWFFWFLIYLGWFAVRNYWVINEQSLGYPSKLGCCIVFCCKN